MKKLNLIICLLLASLGASAQQALWGGAQIISPEVNNNKTVTFRLQAPEAKEVKVTGDFLPTEKIETPFGTSDAPGSAALTKNAEGVWEYTSEVLASELYSYTFLVDGLKINDPSNVYMIRDVASVTSTFIVSGNPGDLYSVQSVPHGTVARTWYHSNVLSKNRRLTIYTPPGYEEGKEKYPVFYLLHGMGGDEEAWIALGRTAQILDNLIAQGKAKPMIVVMTNGNVDQEAAPGESAEGLLKPTMQLPNTMNGKFEEHFPDVISYVESTYRTIAKKESRAIAGLSMGGFHSLHISRYYPDLFDYVGLFSAATSVNDPKSSKVYANVESTLKTQFSKNPKLYWIAMGNTDFLYKNCVEYRALLDKNNCKYIYRESEDGHIWKNWRIYLSEFVPMLFK
ncbi:MAG: esterase [Mangrovibacterium sp.]